MTMNKKTSCTASDKELKEEGNKQFRLGKYEEAIVLYTKAIIKDPNVSVYYTNRAQCHLKLKRWGGACLDCRRALQIDPNSAKGHFFLGQALREMEMFEEAVEHLQRAKNLATEQNLNFCNVTENQLRIAKKQRWDSQENKRIVKEIELMTYLNKLITEDAERHINELKHETLPEKELEERIVNLKNQCDNYLKEVNSMFAKIDDRRKKREVPDYLCGKINLEIMKDPVITPSGITYDRKEIEKHLKINGNFDPVTRAKLTKDQLIPNLAMKEVVDAFLQENEWAIEFP